MLGQARPNSITQVMIYNLGTKRTSVKKTNNPKQCLLSSTNKAFLEWLPVMQMKLKVWRAHSASNFKYHTFYFYLEFNGSFSHFYH